jgi:hypothetical protein
VTFLATDEQWTGEAPCIILHCMRTGLVVAALLATSPALAQQAPIATWQSPQSGFVSAQPSTSPLVSNLQLTAPWLRGEPTGPAGVSSWALSTPLRLSLQGDIQPTAGGFPNCVSREEPSGNTINGFAVQRFASLRLTAALTLQGFSSAGCPIDGAIGAGLTYAVPLDSSLWLVASSGVYGVPGHAPYPPRPSSDVRLDVTKALDHGGTLTVGVGLRGISVGRAW